MEVASSPQATHPRSLGVIKRLSSRMPPHPFTAPGILLPASGGLVTDTYCIVCNTCCRIHTTQRCRGRAKLGANKMLHGHEVAERIPLPQVKRDWGPTAFSACMRCRGGDQPHADSCTHCGPQGNNIRTPPLVQQTSGLVSRLPANGRGHLKTRQ